jgi:hypothetical protein
MLRLVELALFLAPFVLFAVWRFLTMEGGPSIKLLVGVACVLAALVGALVWLRQEDSVPAGTSYQPARFQDGKIVSEQSAPP